VFFSLVELFKVKLGAQNKFKPILPSPILRRPAGPQHSSSPPLSLHTCQNLDTCAGGWIRQGVQNFSHSPSYKIRTRKCASFIKVSQRTGLVAWWSELLTTKHGAPGSIPRCTVGIFPCRQRPP
jgi:hypothetical protein